MASYRAELAARLDEIERVRIETSRNSSFAPASEIASRIAELDHEAASLRRQLAASLDREEEGKAAKSDAAAEHWFQRFLVTLGVANAGAFAALATGLIQSDNPEKIAPIVIGAMRDFAWGTISAGSIPFWLWLRFKADGILKEMFVDGVYPKRMRSIVEGVSEFVVIGVAFISIISFISGLFDALKSVDGLSR